MTDELVNLQTQLSYQDNSLQQLNDVVTRQQGEIETLTKRVNFLYERLRELTTTPRETGIDNRPPPHY